MSNAHVIPPDQFEEVLHDFDHTAFRLELQDSYLERVEASAFDAFLRGDYEPPTAIPELQAWFRRVEAHVRQGKRLERVRVHRDPPTDYQRFVRWTDRWNRDAGETIRYLTRQRAHKIGLLPPAGNTDWWLLDSCRLIAMRFDDEGHRVRNELITDPEIVIQACTWRDLAVHHSVLAQSLDVSA